MNWRDAILSGVAIASALIGFKVLKSHNLVKNAEISQREIMVRQRQGLNPIKCDICDTSATNRYVVCDKHNSRLLGKPICNHIWEDAHCKYCGALEPNSYEMTTAALKDLLRAAGKPTGGKKQDLKERLFGKGFFECKHLKIYVSIDGDRKCLGCDEDWATVNIGTLFGAEEVSKHRIFGREYFEKHNEGKNEHKYYALFKIDKGNDVITYWSAYGRLEGYGRTGSIVLTRLGGNYKYEEIFSKKYKKYEYKGSTIPAKIEANIIQKIKEKWPDIVLGDNKKKSPPKSPLNETDARRDRLRKRFGFNAESLSLVDNCLKCKYKGIRAYHIKDMGWWIYCPNCDYRTEVDESEIAWEISPDWEKSTQAQVSPIEVNWDCEWTKSIDFLKGVSVMKADMFNMKIADGSYGEVFHYKDKALKIVDLEDPDNVNQQQANFFEKIYLMKNKGMKIPETLVEIEHYNRGTITPELKRELKNKSSMLGNKPVGHPIAIWIMEYVPKTYGEVGRKGLITDGREYVDELKQLNKWTEKNLNSQVGDLHPENIGFRKNNSIVVFDPTINRVGEERPYGYIHIG